MSSRGHAYGLWPLPISIHEPHTCPLLLKVAWKEAWSVCRRTQSSKGMLPPVITCTQKRLCMISYLGVVQEVLERHSEMSDPAIANVDQIVLVMSLNLPPFDARQATRFLVSAEAASIPVMLLLNKADLLEDDMTQALVAEVMLIVIATRLHMRSDLLAG